MSDTLALVLSEMMFVICGIVCLVTAIRALKNETGKYTTFAFWTVLAIIFVFGKLIPRTVVGYLIVVLAIISLSKQVTKGNFEPLDKKVCTEHAHKLGNYIFIPALTLGVVAMVLSQLKLASTIAIGTGSICAIAVGFAITKAKPREVTSDTTKLLMTVGAASLLPQLLAGLGSVFTSAGVGDVISSFASGVVPDGSILIGIIVYVLGMVMFTVIMGNAFAAFAVITVGIGIPFVIAQGGNPAVVGALGMTAGYCGTLMTPMAANFNIVSAAIMECKDDKEVIKAQVPVALTLIVVHIVLMYLLAF